MENVVMRLCTCHACFPCSEEEGCRCRTEFVQSITGSDVITCATTVKYSPMTRPNSPSSHEEACSEKGNLGTTLGPTQTGSINHQNPNASTFGERLVDWTLRMEEMESKSARTFTSVLRSEMLHLFFVRTPNVNSL